MPSEAEKPKLRDVVALGLLLASMRVMSGKYFWQKYRRILKDLRSYYMVEQQRKSMFPNGERPNE